MIELVPMAPARRDEFLTNLWRHYFDDMVAAGMQSADAEANIARNQRQLFVDGEPVDGQYFFDGVLDGDAVGHLWLARQGSSDSVDWYVYDVVVDENQRGRGLGRALMEAAESYAIAHGGQRLGLNVFGFNTVARGLYLSLGYREVAVSMQKVL